MEDNQTPKNRIDALFKYFWYISLTVTIILCMLVIFSGRVIGEIVLLLSLPLGIWGFFLGCVILVSPSLILGVVGIKRGKVRWFSIITLVVGLICAFCVLPVKYIGYIPPDAVPQFLKVYKYKKVCNEHFWLDFDTGSVVDIESQINLYGYGMIYFQSEPNTYNVKDVIKYAENNNWKCFCLLKVKASDLKNLNDKKVAVGDPLWAAHSYVSSNYPKFEMNKDFSVLIFSISGRVGIGNSVLITADGSELIVRQVNVKLPEYSNTFNLYPGLSELCEFPEVDEN